MIFAIEKLRICAFGLGLLNLTQIIVDQISDIVGIKTALMLIDDILIELLHLSPILGNLVLSRRNAGETLQRRYIVNCVDLAKETHALLDEKVEASEFGIIDSEACRHHQAADDIANRQRDDR